MCLAQQGSARFSRAQNAGKCDLVDYEFRASDSRTAIRAACHRVDCAVGGLRRGGRDCAARREAAPAGTISSPAITVSNAPRRPERSRMTLIRRSLAGTACALLIAGSALSGQAPPPSSHPSPDYAEEAY